MRSGSGSRSGAWRVLVPLVALSFVPAACATLGSRSSGAPSSSALTARSPSSGPEPAARPATSASTAAPTSTPTSTQTSATATSVVDGSTTTAPAARPYAVAADEAHAGVKVPAVRAVEAVGTYCAGCGSLDLATQRLRAAGAEADAAGAALLLLPEEASNIEVVYPQLGGLTADAASVIVVLRQQLVSGATVRTVSRSVDVRLRADGDAWVVEGFGDMGDAQPAVERPAAGSAAAAVLADGRIELADTARWDVQRGRIDDRLLAVLSQLAPANRLSVTALSSGHSIEVFGTDRTSNHSRGRAVDVWAVDGRPINGRAEPGALLGLLEAASAAGIDEIGTPWPLGLPGSFTDQVHLDHLHLGIRR